MIYNTYRKTPENSAVQPCMIWIIQDDKAEVDSFSISTQKAVNVRGMLFQLNLLQKFDCFKFCLELMQSTW